MRVAASRTDSVRRRLTLAELRRLAGLVQAGLLALHDARVAREEAGALQGHTELGVELDERAGDPVPHRSGLAARTAAVYAHANVIAAFELGYFQRRQRCL